MNKRRPYVRPMTGWWRKNPFFVEYMIHEGTAFFVAAYAVALLCGLLRLAEGEAAWNGWQESLKSPPAIAFHIVTLLMICYHSWTWFKIMPRTMPPITIGDQRLSGSVITGIGLAAVAVASLVLFGLVWGISA